MKIPKSFVLVLFVILPFAGFYFCKSFTPFEKSFYPSSTKPVGETSKLSELEVNKLKELGLANPESDLKTDLIKHPELIPYEGVLGGTMGFYSESAVQVLTTSWVLAGFEDGHVYGHLLLKYNIAESGVIEWEVIDSQLW